MADEPLPSEPVSTLPVPSLPAPVPAQDSLSQEVDVWWGGYDVRALVPSLLTGVFFTLLIVGAAYSLWGQYGVRPNLARWVAYYLSGILWLYHLVRWAYRIVGYNYRLTTQRLYIWWGIYSLPPPPIQLRDIQGIQIEATKLETFFSIGRIVLQVKHCPQPVVLHGVYRPQPIADLIGRYAKTSQATPAQEAEPAGSP